jgi:iron complex outermembrane recepter protein
MTPNPCPQSRGPFSASRKMTVLCSASALALVLGIIPVNAQEKTTAPSDAPVVLDAFVVTGVRASLISAQQIKQNSVPIVESIVAEDIGKLPDNTVADALQRVPGIQVGRNIGEVSSVVIRGLPNLSTTLNGNEIFTGVGRGVALQDIPSELIAGVDVYKSTTPDKIEGGIAGLIDIRLHRPFDFKKPQLALSGQGIYGENADKTSYTGSLLLSNRWKVGNGEMGLLYSGSYQQRYFVDQIAFNFLFEPVGVPPTLVPGQTELQLPFTQGGQVIPAHRKRQAHTVSFQWRVNDEIEIYNDFLNTSYRGDHQVHFLIGFPRFGAFTAATVYPNTNIPITTTSDNNFHLTSTQAFKQRTDGYQDVLGMKWARGDTKFIGEYLYNWNSFKNQAVIVDTRFGPATPGKFQFTYNDGGRANLKITGADPTAASNYYLWGLFDNRDYSTSEQNGLKAEIEQGLSGGFFKKVLGGLRWSDRSVRFRGTSRNDIAPLGTVDGERAAPTVPNASTIAGFGSVNPDGPLSYYSTPHWYGASPDFLYNHTDQVRALFGLPAGPAAFNPTLGFTDDESVFAGYVDTRYSTLLGGKVFDGSIGVRVARSTQDLQGYRTDGTVIDSSKSQTDVLPVFNSRLKLNEQLQLRFSAGRTVTRPNFTDLNPAVTLNSPTTTGGGAGTGNGGNPDLETVKSDNYDLALEYYFDKASYASITGFHRDIDGYVQTFAGAETIGGVTYNVIRPRNSGKGKLDGFELSYQQFPEFLKGFGWMANYTYIKGDTDAPDSSPGAAVGARVRKPYAQVSRDSYNIILIYERAKFSSRLAYNWRGEFTDTFDGPNAPGSPLRQIIVKARDTLDFSASYAFTDHLRVTVDATNILKSEYQDYFYDASRYPRDTRAYDRTISVGLRYRY